MTHEVFLHIDEIVLDGVSVPSNFQDQLERELQRVLASADLAARLAGSGDALRVSVGQLDAGELRLGAMTIGASLGQALAAQVLATLPNAQVGSWAAGAASPALLAGPMTGSSGKEQA